MYLHQSLETNNIAAKTPQEVENLLEHTLGVG